VRLKAGSTPLRSLSLRLAEVLVEFLVYRVFDRRLEQRQHQSKLTVETDIFLADVQQAGEPGPLELDRIALPAIANM